MRPTSDKRIPRLLASMLVKLPPKNKAKLVPSSSLVPDPNSVLVGGNMDLAQPILLMEIRTILLSTTIITSLRESQILMIGMLLPVANSSSRELAKNVLENQDMKRLSLAQTFPP